MQDQSSTVATGQSRALGLVGRPGRGIQLEDVLCAADSLVDEGLKPTIERVRQKLGRGSPNTVSPMLDVWFSTLGQRLKGVPTVADEEARKLPLEVVQIAQRFWDVVTHNAKQAQIQHTEATRRELELQQAALEARELHLKQREAAFEETRQRLDAALASSQQEREALGRQLADQAAQSQEQATDASRQRRASEAEIARLNAAISELQASKEALRSQNAAASPLRSATPVRAKSATSNGTWPPSGGCSPMSTAHARRPSRPWPRRPRSALRVHSPNSCSPNCGTT